MRFIGFSFIPLDERKKQRIIQQMLNNPNFTKRVIRTRKHPISEPTLSDVSNLADLIPLGYTIAQSGKDADLDIDMSDNGFSVALYSLTDQGVNPFILMRVGENVARVSELLANKMIEKGITEEKVLPPTPGNETIAQKDPNRFPQKVYGNLSNRGFKTFLDRRI